jgi:ABC-2 type transport system permease protein
MSAAPVDGQTAAAVAPRPATRPLWWSVRRELWENRSLWIAPLAVAAVVLVATSIATVRALDPAGGPEALVGPFQTAPAPIMLATFLVGLFYALDALYGERRDRSILFWKSLPVSDLTTVVSKAIVPLAVLPSIAFVLCVAVQLVLLVVVFAVALAGGAGPAGLWAELGFVEGLPIMAYGLAVHALWFAPFYGWLLLVSAWARRVPLLWAVLPPLAIGIVERITAGTPHFTSLLRYRVTGALTEAFSASGGGGEVEDLDQLDPGRFLATPGLWLGLLFTVACLAAAVRLRRRREPI